MSNRTLKIAAVVLALVIVPLANAGTPLICFPFDIGNAKSLPWIADGGIGSPRSDYDLKKLADDTIALLGEFTPVIVRMETIRRAALYSAKNDEVAAQLAARLKARAGQETGVMHALALFDYGYTLETMKQATSERSRSGPAASAHDGYGFILQAIRERGNDPEMEFAAAKVAVWPRTDGYVVHLRKAAAGADRDPLLASNLHAQFSSDEIQQAGVSKESRRRD